MAKQLLLGNQAAAMGARDGGIAVISSYPGTPSTEITETAAAFPEVYTEWAANEKVAAEAALGSAVTGKRAMCCMKHVGLNVAADLLFTAAYTGVNAGLVLAVADDPGMHSSQNEQDTRMIAQAAHVPVLEPADSQECYDYFKYAPQLSETLDMPVIVRLTTRISHARGFVALGDQVENFEKDYEKQPAKYIMMPGYARGRKVDLLKRIEAAKKLSDSTELNRIEAGDGKVGVICSGVCYQYVKEALPHASILKLGMVYPLPEQKIRDFAASVEKLYVVEELEPYIQRYVESFWQSGRAERKPGKAGSRGCGCADSARCQRSAPPPAGIVRWMSASRCVLRAQEDGADGIWRYRLLYTGRHAAAGGDGYHHLYGRQHFHGAWGRKGERARFCEKVARHYRGFDVFPQWDDRPGNRQL